MAFGRPILRSTSYGAQVINPQLLGSARPPRRLQRVEEGNLADDVTAGTHDHFSGRGPVSIEREAEQVLKMQEALDSRVVGENNYDDVGDEKGLLPCQKVRRGES